MSRNFTAKQVEEAVRNCGGTVSGVARLLGCEWHTAEKYINKWDKTKNLMEDYLNRTTEVAVSYVVNEIMKAADPEKPDPDWRAVTYWLNARGRKYGFGINNVALTDSEGSSVSEIAIKLVRPDDETSGATRES